MDNNCIYLMGNEEIKFCNICDRVIPMDWCKDCNYKVSEEDIDKCQE